MNTFAKALVEAHAADLHREAARARQRAAARAALASIPWVARPVTLRTATDRDAAPLVSLAALDSAEVPAAPRLVAE